MARAARFFKTRSLAQQAIAAGRVKLNDARVKSSHELKVADAVTVRIGDFEWKIVVKQLDKRGPAERARKLYEENRRAAERERRMDLRRWGAEPASTLKGRPTKRDRRLIDDFPVRQTNPSHHAEALAFGPHYGHLAFGEIRWTGQGVKRVAVARNHAICAARHRR